MHKSHFLIGSTILLLTGCNASKTPEKKEPVLFTVAGKPVTTSEFNYVYNKNNSQQDNAAKGSVQEYLELYTNFKLKVTEAEKRGLDTTTAFRKELEGYKEQLAQPYLTEKNVTDQLVKEAYERLKQEVNASHILVNVEPDAEPKDTLAAYNKIMDLRRRVQAGEDFNALARAESDDPSAKENSGNLGYFTALQMLYPFEKAAYSTPVGQLSNPVRTRFGFHLIRVNNVRPAQGEIKVAHIMVRATPGIPKADSVVAKKKIDAIYSRLTRKENWDKLTAQFSEDASSSTKGGELPWFGTGRMLPSFEEAAFKLTTIGEISQPVQTPYGWHIIKLIERRGLPAYEEMEPYLRSKVAKDSRSELNKSAFLKRIKQENNFQETKTAKDFALSKANDALKEGNWQYTGTEKEVNQTLFTLQGRAFTVKDFFNYVQTNQKGTTNATSPAHIMNVLYDNFVSNSLLSFEREHLESKYVDYRMLVNEYRDGILLFQLMDEKVWSKAIQDTVGLQAFFEKNKENYKWDTRADAIIISAANKEILAQAQQMLTAGKFELKKMRPEPILFPAGKDAITPAIANQLNEIFDRLSNDPALTLQLTGNADVKESTGKIPGLANKRAENVAAFLTNKGIAANRLTLTANKPKPATAANRNVTFALFTSDLKGIEEALNTTNPLAVQVHSKRFQKGENKLLDEVTWHEGTYNLEKDGRAVFIKINQVLPPGYKTLNEVRGLATSDYQTYLEKEWLKELRQKYPVQVNEAEVQKLTQK
ncbi:peptidylprolyl isomerase [Adhaeribacter swui]|uniref:Peptidylprolyl isomerase n=1 Tax=Adhaeribacter swui TaxID=2086471 RepID=A0A7G7G9R2_9BACT|nr:peptidylprolyl isomerase [Adhaeribacter swui]QNF33896.1 peptidylprolyl isomerase [Adhaeribacter swui]